MEKLIVNRYDLIYESIWKVIGAEDDQKVDEMLKNVEEETKAVNVDPNGEAKYVFNVEFKVNGVELSFEDIIKAYNKAYYDKVDSAARRLISDKIGGIIYSLSNIEENIEYVKLEVKDTLEKQGAEKNSCYNKTSRCKKQKI